MCTCMCVYACTYVNAHTHKCTLARIHIRTQTQKFMARESVLLSQSLSYSLFMLFGQVLLKRIVNQQPYYSNRDFTKHAAQMHKDITHKCKFENTVFPLHPLRRRQEELVILMSRTHSGPAINFNLSY